MGLGGECQSQGAALSNLGTGPQACFPGKAFLGRLWASSFLTSVPASCLSVCSIIRDYTRSSLILLPASGGWRVPVALQLLRDRAWGQQRVTGHWGPPRPFANGCASRPVSLALES